MTALEFIQSLKERVNPEALAGKDPSVFHFDIEGEGQKTVKIENGNIEVLNGLVGESKCTIKAKGETFMKVIKGEENATMAVMMGKIKVSNLGELMKYAKAFGLM